MKFRYGWSGMLFAAENPEERECLKRLVELLRKSGHKIIDDDGFNGDLPTWNDEKGILGIPGE